MKRVLFMVFNCGPLEQTTWFIDSAPPAELSYLPNCSLGLAIFPCASSMFQKGIKGNCLN